MKKIIGLILSLLLIFSNIQIAKAANYVYDKNGRLTEVKYDSGRTIFYEYDKGGNIIKVINNQEEGLISLQFENLKQVIDLNEKIKIDIRGIFSDGRSEIITEKVNFKSSNDLVLKINQGGELEGTAIGQVILTAEYMGRKVSEEVYVGMEIRNSLIGGEIKKDSNLNFTAITSEANENIKWLVSDESIGTIDSSGNLIILKTGTIKITAISKGVAKSITITIVD